MEAAKTTDIILVLGSKYVDIYVRTDSGAYALKRAAEATDLTDSAQFFWQAINNFNTSLPLITNTKNTAVVYTASNAGIDAKIFALLLRNFIVAVEKRFPAPATIAFVIADHALSNKKNISGTVRALLATKLAEITDTRVAYDRDYAVNVLGGIEIIKDVGNSNYLVNDMPVAQNVSSHQQCCAIM